MLEQLAASLTKVVARIRVDHSARKFLTLSGLLLILLPAMAVAPIAIWTPDKLAALTNKDNPVLALPALIGVLFLLLVAMSYLQMAGEKRDDPQAIAKAFGAAIPEVAARQGDSGNGDVVADNIQATLGQVSEYYSINKAQARNSFWLSVSLILLGFVPLAYAAWRSSGSGASADVIAGFSAASGIILEFIATTAFFVYRNSIRQTNIYFAQLSRLQDTMLAIDLTSRIPKEDARATAIVRVIEKLLDRGLSEGPIPLDVPKPRAQRARTVRKSLKR